MTRTPSSGDLRRFTAARLRRVDSHRWSSRAQQPRPQQLGDALRGCEQHGVRPIQRIRGSGRTPVSPDAGQAVPAAHDRQPRGLWTVSGPGDHRHPECPGLRGRGRPRWLERPEDHKLHAIPADRGAGIFEPAAVSPGHWATSVEGPSLRPEPADGSRATEPATGSCRWSRLEPAGPSRWATGQAQPLGWDSARPRQAHDGAGGDGDSCWVPTSEWVRVTRPRGTATARPISQAVR